MAVFFLVLSNTMALTTWFEDHLEGKNILWRNKVFPRLEKQLIMINK